MEKNRYHLKILEEIVFGKKMYIGLQVNTFFPPRKLQRKGGNRYTNKYTWLQFMVHWAEITTQKEGPGFEPCHPEEHKKSCLSLPLLLLHTLYYDQEIVQ